MVYLAVDIGGTNGRVAAYGNFNDRESLLSKENFTMSGSGDDSSGDYMADLLHFTAACRRLSERHGPIEGIGVALAGKVNHDRTDLVLAGNLKHWVGQGFVARVQDVFGCPVVLENDAAALALAEAIYGLGSTSEFAGQPFIGMIGGAAVRPMANGGFITIPGEPGHLLVGPRNGIVCGCGQSGCVESLAGGASLERQYGVPAEQLTPELWLTTLGWLSKGLQQYLRVQPVDLLVFSGGIAVHQQWLLPELQQLLDSPEFGSPVVRLSHFGETAGTLGALSLLSPKSVAVSSVQR